MAAGGQNLRLLRLGGIDGFILLHLGLAGKHLPAVGQANGAFLHVPWPPQGASGFNPAMI